MKAKTREKRARPTTVAAGARQARAPRWPWLVAAAAAFIAVFWAYAPALHGEFLFDDYVFPFALPNASAGLRAWLGNVRPVLYLTYWVNAQIAKDDPFSFHVVNVLIHFIASGLMFLILRRLLEWSATGSFRRDLLAGFGAAVFLLHPVQTEAVAYLAGRSESLSVMFFLAAFTVFLYRRESVVSWRVAAAVLALFAVALLSKEHTVVLPALLLLTDYWWNPGFPFRGIRANWRLYVPMAVSAVCGLAFFWRIITSAESAGFGLKDFTWYQYFFTQCRALFVYIGEFFLPVNQNADWDFSISKTILDRGAVIGLLVLLALAAAAWRYRRRFPLATFGFFCFLLLMAPTSSVLPIRDAVAERRLYLGMLGLLLIVMDIAGRIRLAPKVLAASCAVIALIAAGATRARAAIWSDPLTLWQDTARKSPDKARVRFQLGYTWSDRGRPDLAVAEFEKTAQLKPPSWMKYNLLVDWALAYNAQGRFDLALAKLREAAAMESTAHIYSQIGMVYAEQARWDEALEALATAEKLDPGFAMVYVYRGNIFLNQNRPAEAIPQYQRALALQPTLDEARRNLLRAQQAMRGAR
jgi:tetratricopeptide (TPR) repeat protein